MYFPSSYFRLKAREALKGHWQTALLIALIVNLPQLVAQGLASFTGNDPTVRLQNIILTASRDGVLSNALITSQIQAWLQSSGFWISAGLAVAAWLVTPWLSLGMNRWLVHRLRNVPEEPVRSVFRPAALFPKALGLQLLVLLKVFLWMLPGIAAVALAMLPLYRAGNNAAAVNNALRLSQGLMFPAVALAAVPGVMAALRYAMAEFILADEPETRVRACVRRSIEQMRDNKKMLFILMVSFLLWYVLQLLVASFLSGFGSGVLSLVFQMLSGLAISVYLSAAMASFYLETAMGRIPRKENERET